MVERGGLSQAEATTRLRTEGPNALPEPERRDFVRIAGDTLSALLLAAAMPCACRC